MTSVHVAFLETNRTGSGYEVMRVAKERGYQVTLVAKDLDFYRQPGQQQIPMDVFDQVVNCDTDDPEAVAATLSGLEHRPDALLSASEFHMFATARTGRLLKVRGQDPEAVRACRDKSRGRQLSAAAGVPIPRFVLAATPEEAAAADVGFPCVVKPLDDSGSYGVKLCANAQEVADHAKALLAWTHNEVGQPKLPSVLVEEYMHGREISVEVIVADSRARVVAMTDKVLLDPPVFYEIGHTVPASLDPQAEAACREVAVQALEAIGYDFGAAHVELMITDDGPRLVEVNCRARGRPDHPAGQDGDGVRHARGAARHPPRSRPRRTARPGARRGHRVRGEPRRPDSFPRRGRGRPVDALRDGSGQVRRARRGPSGRGRGLRPPRLHDRSRSGRTVRRSRREGRGRRDQGGLRTRSGN